jgi:glycosyltransferase involved in cell wall biosynthesis
LRIAQVAPLYESAPPALYGGTERVVSYLTEELVRMGHDVTLYASGDSRTAARLVPICQRALRLDETIVDFFAYHVLLVERVLRDARRYDVVHFHCDYIHYPASRRAVPSHVTTLHGRLDLPELQSLYREFEEIPVVSISNAQRAPIELANWQATVYHGLPPESLRFRPAPGGYLAFLGRISPDKRADRAIEIARAAGMPLKIAAKVDPADREYFEAEIEPLLEADHVEFVGEISEEEKSEFLGGARALVFPIDWPEPFGLVMIEALACGTPVVAYRHGSVPEVIENGVNGFVVEDRESAVAAVRRIGEISRESCRRIFEERFSAARMARDYVRVYERLAGRAAA